MKNTDSLLTKGIPEEGEIEKVLMVCSYSLNFQLHQITVIDILLNANPNSLVFV